MTYLQIVRLLERYAWNQPDVHSVVREFTDLNRETAQYAAVVIQDRDGERDLISDQDWITYTWHIGYVDRLWEEKMTTSYGEQGERLGSDNILTNRDDIYSQGIRVINNIIAGLRKDYDLEITTPDRINTFNQRFTAECAGVYMVIAVTVPVSDCEDSGVESMYDSLNQQFTTNGTYHFVPEGKPWDQADIVIDVHPQDSLVTNFTENGTYDLEGEWKDATIGVNVPEEKPEVGLDDTIWVTPYTPRDYNWTPPEGYVYSSAHIEVVCNEGPLFETITSNGEYQYEPVGGSSGIDMYNQVNLSVDVHPSTSLSANYTENGVYTIAGEFNGGRIDVDVFVPVADPGYVYVSQNGTQDIYPEHPENEVFSYMTVVTDVHPSTSLSETYTSNGTYSISGEFNGGEITVAVSSQKPEESLVETITSNGSYNYTPQAGYVFDSVALSVDVHPSTSLSRSYTTNGQKTITGEFNGGTININVHPSTSLSETYISNGTYNISGEFNGGEITVAVSSQKPEESLVETITSNGSYSYVPQAGYVYDSVSISVNVPQQYRIGYNIASGWSGPFSPFEPTHFGSNYLYSTLVRSDFGTFEFDGPVTEIGDGALQFLAGISYIIIPRSVTSIGDAAFWYCEGLTEIDLANGGGDTVASGNIITIGDQAFGHCTSASIAYLPDSVTSIGDEAFVDCSSLAEIWVTSSIPPTLGTDAFLNTPSNMRIMVPPSLVNTYKTATGWSIYSSQIFPQGS